MRFIKYAQRFGLRLEEIGELLEIQQRGLCPCGHTRRLLERRLSELDDDMAAMARLRRDIADARGAARPGRRRRAHEPGKGGESMSNDGCNCGCSTAAAEKTDESSACDCGCGDSGKADAGESR